MIRAQHPIRSIQVRRFGSIRDNFGRTVILEKNRLEIYADR